MDFTALVSQFVEDDISESTMMGSACLRCNGDFVSMFFDKEESLIVKELISLGIGNEFNYTKKPFKEWVVIPLDSEDQYPDFIRESIEYVRNKNNKVLT